MKYAIIGLMVGLFSLNASAEQRQAGSEADYFPCPPYCICRRGQLPECTMSPDKDQDKKVLIQARNTALIGEGESTI
ncbi:MAG: hypothetical protein Tsb002_19620 [Wenzhouxiangellaceae bacterium]